MTTTTPSAEVLLATYIPESFPEALAYLPEQLDSLLEQDYPNFRILIRDDGSSQAALDVLKAYQKKHPDIIEIIEDDLGNLKHAKNFATLMKASTADYILCCDQDDIWHPEKISRCISTLQQHEHQNPNRPMMVYHDAHLIDENGNDLKEPIPQEFLRPDIELNLSTTITSVSTLGFATCANRALIERQNQIKDYQYRGHDCVMGIIAALYGNIIEIDDKLAQHRVHGKNVTTALQNDGKYSLRNVFDAMVKRPFSTWKDLSKRAENFMLDYTQTARNLLEICENDAVPVSTNKIKLLKDFIALSNSNISQRLKAISRHRLFEHRPKLKLALIFGLNKQPNSPNHAGSHDAYPALHTQDIAVGPFLGVSDP